MSYKKKAGSKMRKWIKKTSVNPTTPGSTALEEIPLLKGLAGLKDGGKDEES